MKRFGHDADHNPNRSLRTELAADGYRNTRKLRSTGSPGRRPVRRLASNRPPSDPANQWSHPHDIEGVERAVVAAKPLRIALAGPQHIADRWTRWCRRSNCVRRCRGTGRSSITRPGRPASRGSRFGRSSTGRRLDKEMDPEQPHEGRCRSPSSP